ncbi:MAG: DUF177 domain-containing protein [Chitinispirillaceae bacterium]|nr:DUF177 domain-containing protein [Chitinispirillaceae bacterium]
MILNACIIHEGHSTIRQSSDLESVRDDLPPFSDNVECCAELDRNHATIYARIHFSGLFEQQCARCLTKYKHPVSGDIGLILQERKGRQGAAREGETADFYFNSRHSQVDISSAIYDEIMTSLPLKPLCAETCQGIMPEQKRDDLSVQKNTQRDYDPRWEALRKLQNKT